MAGALPVSGIFIGISAGIVAVPSLLKVGKSCGHTTASALRSATVVMALNVILAEDACRYV
jgi:hypothetical protein